MSETVRGVGKLEGDRDGAIRPEEPRSIPHQLPHAFLADRRRQEVEEHGPLVMPGQRTARLGDQVSLRDPVLTKSVHQAVVSLEHGDVHLRDKKVDVLTWVTNE